MNWLVVANPAAGRAGEVRAALRALRRRMPDATFVETAGRGDVARAVRGASDAASVAVVGGDGTIAEVLTTLDRPRQRLAVVPAGHGNCLARELHVGTLERSLRAIDADCVATIDLIAVTLASAGRPPQRRLAASTLSAGYVAEVVATGRTRYAALGRAAYATAAVLTPPHWFDADVALDGEHRSGRYTGLVVNNTRWLANFAGLPDARVDDGLLDVMELGCGWPQQLLHDAAVLLHSRRWGPRRAGQASRVGLAWPEPRTVMVDGEPVEDVVALHAVCVPRALRCIAGAA